MSLTVIEGGGSDTGIPTCERDLIRKTWRRSRNDSERATAVMELTVQWVARACLDIPGSVASHKPQTKMRVATMLSLMGEIGRAFERVVAERRPLAGAHDFLKEVERLMRDTGLDPDM